VTDFKHTPPDKRPLDEPLRMIVINDTWASHVQGLFGIATSESYWASDNEQARDDAIGVEQIIAQGDSRLFPVLHCHIRRTTDQTITNNTATIVNFDTEVIDVGDLFDAAQDDRIQLPEPGIWLVGGQIRWKNNSVGQRDLLLQPNIIPVIYSVKHFYGAGTLDIPFLGKINVGAADYVRLSVRQTSGGDLDLQTVTGRSIDLWVHYLGPL